MSTDPQVGIWKRCHLCGFETEAGWGSKTLSKHSKEHPNTPEGDWEYHEKSNWSDRHPLP